MALLIETARSYGRSLLRGIRRYTAEHRPWSVYLDMRSLDSPPPAWLPEWHGDGILARTGSQAMADAIARTGAPTVELRATRLRGTSPYFVGVDNAALGQMIADHFLERGLRQFGVYELDTEEYLQQRRDNFLSTLAAKGYPCSVFHAPDRRETPADWEQQQAALTCWVAGLPKPVGIMCSTDQLGFWLLDACRRAGVAVPEEVAVVGVENEESLCSMSTPPLSSVQFDCEHIGYEAAALLDKLMLGEPLAAGPIVFPPLGIVTRQSSEVIAIDDEDLATALRFIRQQACAGIGPEDVVRAVCTSRSTLERRMRHRLGRTIKEEILRIRFQHVQELLSITDLPLAAIAEKTGFRHPQYLAEAFKNRFGRTPGAYRAQFDG